VEDDEEKKNIDDLFAFEETPLRIQSDRTQEIFRTNRSVFLDSDEREYITRARFEYISKIYNYKVLKQLKRFQIINISRIHI